MRFLLILIVLVTIWIDNSNGSVNKTLWTITSSVNSVLCVSVSYFYSLGSVGNLGHLLIVKREVDSKGNSLESDKEVDKIPLVRALAINWNQYSRTIYFDHSGNYIISLIHNQPTDIQSTAVIVDVTLTTKRCSHESSDIYPTDPPITDLPSTPKVEVSSPVTEFKTTTEWLTTSLSVQSTESYTTNQSTIIVTTPTEHDESGTTVDDHQSVTTDSIDQQSTSMVTAYSTKLDTTNSVEPTSTINYFTEISTDENQPTQTVTSSTKMDTSTTQTSDGQVTTDKSYSSTESTILSTTINSIVTMSSTINLFTETSSIDENQSTTPTINYDGQVSTKSSIETSSQITDSTQQTTTINDSVANLNQPGVSEIYPNIDKIDTKTGDLTNDLIATIKMLINKDNLIYSICTIVGLIVVITSLTIAINHLRSETWNPSESNVSVDPTGVELDVLTFHRRTINSNILKVLSDYRKSRKSMAETVIQFKK